MVVRVAARTDVGPIREKNEDAYHVDPHAGLYVICDGLGGHAAGDVASRKAIEFVVDYISRHRSSTSLPRRGQPGFLESWNRLVVEAVEFCCDELLRFGQSSPELEGFATTLTLLLLVDGFGFVGHVGDSRLYLKQRCEVRQLTRDHTMFEEFTRGNRNGFSLNPDVDVLKRFRHILTRCVGRGTEMHADIFNFRLATDDVLLLCTDGLSNCFPDEKSIFSLLDDDDPESVVETLVKFANQQGSSDNMTAIVIRVLDPEVSQCDSRVAQPEGWNAS